MAPADTSPPSGRASDDLYRVLADQIERGVLPAGAPLPPEREIVETHGVSRTVVREAVQALAGHGLVEARPRHRPVVRRPDYDAALGTLQGVVQHLLNLPDGIWNLFQTRIMIEAMLVREAAIRADRDDLRQLRDALAANKAAIEDSEAFYRTDMAFHQALFRVPRNPVLPAVHRAYTDWLSPQWSRMPRLPARNRENFEAHSAILDAILMRDPDAAEAALRSHLDNAWRQVHTTFDAA